MTDDELDNKPVTDSEFGDFMSGIGANANEIPIEKVKWKLCQVDGTPEQPKLNQFNPDWDAMAVMVKEQQRMAKRIEELEAATLQPARQWVGLNDVEIVAALTDLPHFRMYFLQIARAVEGALKEKNTDTVIGFLGANT